MKKILFLKINLFALVLLITPLGASAQSLQWMKNAPFRIKYQIPTDWTHVRHGNDTITFVNHVSPERDMMLFVGKLKGAALHTGPEQALEGLLANFGVEGNRVFQTRYNRIRFFETTGSGVLLGPGLFDEQVVRYDAMAAEHRGNIILVYVASTSDSFARHKQLMESVVKSISPYRGR
jgi:hypothetical protein